MRPYLAVLKDSFREALASRILWILTGLITLVLFVGLAPFALQEEAAARFHRNEFRNGPEFLKLLAAQDEVKKPTPARQVWLRLPESLRHRVKAVNPNDIKEQLEVLGGVRSEFNGMLNSRNLYDPAAWDPAKLSGEARRLLGTDASNLSPESLRRLNRLLIDAAFPQNVLRAPDKVLHAVWFGYQLGTPLPFEPRQLGMLVKYALAVLTAYVAGLLGVLIAILVTAPLVPLTFEPGAIDLLLSKPVSRSLLFLTKFFGASTFILLNSLYLIGGMWLIAGLRFDIWSGRLLLCVPVLLFLFVIYYSVSALAGVIWRNAIVSVCCAILFWGICFTVGVAKSVAESQFLNPTRLTTLVPAGDKLLAVNAGGQTFEWSADRKIWDEVFQGSSEGGPPFFLRGSLIGPVYDAKNDRLCAIEATRTRFDFFGGVNKLVVGPAKEEWRRIENAVTPSAPQAIFTEADGRIVVVSLSGIYRLQGDASIEHRSFKLLGIDIAPHDRSVRFVRIGPEPDPKWHRPFAAARNPRDGRIAVVSRGALWVLGLRSNGDYGLDSKIDLGTETATAVAFAGSRIAVGFNDGFVRVFAGSSLKEEFSLQPPGHGKPRQLAASQNGRWLALVYDNRRASLCDLQTHGVDNRMRGQGDISCAGFASDDHLLVSDGFARVTEYQVDPMKEIRKFQPPAEMLELLYTYVVSPLYTVLPKPGQLDEVVQYLVVGDPIELFDQGRSSRDELSTSKRPVDIWQPLWTNLAFLAMMLTMTCVYIARRDF